ncbi:MAG: chorismate synthase [Acidobacteria bacterium]|nr:chorismate synthase [Acidobacteriota bacterium]
MLRFMTAGESHGRSLAGILEGLPGGLAVDRDFINFQLYRRQLGFGRGERMKIERDRIEIISGIRHGKTLGSPISFLIENRDWVKWQLPMSADPVPEGTDVMSVMQPRPGHADLAGILKYQTGDIRDILERASARETASRVAAGAFCRTMLMHFGIRIGSHVIAVGNEHVAERFEDLKGTEILDIDPESPVRCADSDAAGRMMAAISAAKESGDTLGGVFEAVAVGVPPGLGSHIQWDRKLDGRIAQAMMSIPAAKGVEIGTAFAGAQSSGSAVHDAIIYDARKRRFYHETNRAGGVEGGISNGEDIRVRVHMKPIPTLRKPLKSVNIENKQETAAAFERSDTCVVPAAGVVAESMLSYILADVFLEKFGGDSIREIEGNFKNYINLLEEF